MLKIMYLSKINRNCILFVLMSYLFMLIQSAIIMDDSFLSLVFVKNNLRNSFLLIFLLITSTWMIYFDSRYARAGHLSVVLYCIFISIQNLIIEFDKLILFALFVYVIIAYFYYQLLIEEGSRAYKNPLYKLKDLFLPIMKKNSVRLIDSTGSIYSGNLTNWDDFGCFVYLDKEVVSLKKGDLQIEVNFNNLTFVQVGSVRAIAKDKHGIGLVIKNKNLKSYKFGWDDFITNVNNLGFRPEF